MALRLLVVEDSESIRFGLAEYFTARGFAVDSAARLGDAVTLLHEFRYDIVITDLRLSDERQVEGLDIIADVRARCPGTRVVLLTAYGSASVQAAAAHLGVDLFLQKPIRLADLENAAVRLIESAA